VSLEEPRDSDAEEKCECCAQERLEYPTPKACWNACVLDTPLTRSTTRPLPAAVTYQRLVRTATIAVTVHTVMMATATSPTPRR
jgi:hypothetical protein